MKIQILHETFSYINNEKHSEGVKHRGYSYQSECNWNLYYWKLYIQMDHSVVYY